MVFTESLHLELELMGSGVKVQVLCPGLTRTDFHERIGIDETKQVNKGLIKWMSPEEVVDISIRALGKKQVVCVPGLLNKLRVLLPTILPGPVYYQMLFSFYRKNVLKKVETV